MREIFAMMLGGLAIGGLILAAAFWGVNSEPTQDPEVITVYEERCFSEEAQYLDEMVSAHEHFKKMRSF
jgi:hypothetical protein